MRRSRTTTMLAASIPSAPAERIWGTFTNACGQVSESDAFKRRCGGVLVGTLAVVLGCGPTAIERRVLEASRKSSPATKKQLVPPSNGLRGASPERKQPTKKPKGGSEVSDVAAAELPEDVGEPTPEDSRPPKKDGFASSNPWPPSVAPADGRFGSIELPGGITFSDRAVRYDRQQLTTLFPAGGNNARPVYTEFYPGNKLALAVSLSPDRVELEGHAVSFFEDGPAQTIAAYRRGDLQGPLRIYEATGQIALYADMQNGRRHGLLVGFVRGWPVVVQKWDKEILAESWLIVNSQAVPTAAQAFAPATTAKTLVEADLIARFNRAMANEKTLRSAILKWYSKARENFKKTQAKITGPINRQNSALQAEAFESAANASFQQAYQETIRAMVPK